MVLAAAEAAEAGKSVGEILAMLEDITARIEMSFVLDRLDYMKKGGRCSAVTALGANLLKLHPCIEVIDGKMGVTKKYRGSIEKVVMDYLRERLADRTDIDTRRAILVDTCQDDRLAAIGREFLKEDGRFEEVLEAKAGCTIFSHSGPGTLGIVFLRN
jgi:DegV family protein with EDD domain